MYFNSVKRWLIIERKTLILLLACMDSKLFESKLRYLSQMSGCWLLPYILSTIPLSIKQILSQGKEQTLTVQSYPKEELKLNEELKNIINVLISRVQNLETAKAEQSNKLMNLEQVLRERNQNRCRNVNLAHLKIEIQTLKDLYMHLKSCCDVTRTINNERIQKQVDHAFTNFFGNSYSKEDIVKIYEFMNQKLQDSDLEKPKEDSVSKNYIGEHSNLNLDEVRKVVSDVLKIYDADKTGQVDYALESAGGHIISIRCTQQYSINTRIFSIVGLIPYSYDTNDPRTVIQGNPLQPGMCWAFQDFPGYLLIKLRSKIYVTGFTIEHASRLNLPNGEMKSAPKKFDIWGFKEENDSEPVMFGEYEFLNSHDNLQYFPVQNTSISIPYEYVELRIHSNHGQLEYTCLYRFRIHGNLA